MMRKMMVVLALSVVAGAGCKKKNEAEGTAGASSGASASASEGTSPANGAGAKKKWSTVDRVPFAKLQTLLPETLGALKRTDLGGSMQPQDEYTHSEANAHYEGPNDSAMQLTIEDNPVHSEEKIPSKTSSFKGYPVVTEREGGGSADLEVIVGDRFSVRAHGTGLKAAEIKGHLEKLDLAKLASWKDEGVKK